MAEELKKVALVMTDLSFWLLLFILLFGAFGGGLVSSFIGLFFLMFIPFRFLNSLILAGGKCGRRA